MSEDACREYQSSLEDLTFNSKPHINMLTILAEENLHFAKDIVAIIEAQIAKAPPAEKLPVLYLVDSIVKNVGGEYLTVFSKNIVTSFILVFEKVDEATRKSLFKLRSTWDEIFPLKKLYALDVRVNSLDPAWPIKPLPPNVNASIHVNPKFLKQTEEVTASRVSAPQPPSHPMVSEKNLTQEQVIRQQLLAKQKQLLELQQKKIELELEQTKAQLAANQLVSAPNPSINPPSQAAVGMRSVQAPPVQSSKPWHMMQQDPKISTRDPRLNRPGQAPLHVKDQVPNKKESHCVVPNLCEKRVNISTEKLNKFDKMKIPRKELPEEKSKSKSPPLNKVIQGKSKAFESESVKVAELSKRDPRLRKHLHDKAEVKDDDGKDKKRFSDKRERDDSAKEAEYRSAGARNKLINGSVNKYEALDKQDSKPKNAAVRKRSRSRSRSPLLHSPKRKDRRSPKRRMRSVSSSPPKSGKGRQAGGKHLHAEDFAPRVMLREERAPPKKNASEPRRQKRLLEERPVESHSPRLPSDLKENANKRWRSGWEENKHLKQPEENLVQGKSGLHRHKPSWVAIQRGPLSRIPKHRLSVDANLQIPEVLNSANKRDLLRKASKRLADGELSNDDFLDVAHQINQLFQYQEEKQRSDSWDGSSDDAQFGTRKKPLLSTPPTQQTNLSDAEISYYEHKAKLRRTQVQHQGGRDRQSPYNERVQHPRPLFEDDDQGKGGPELHKRYRGTTDSVTVEDSAKSVHRHDELQKNDSSSSFKNSPSPVNFEHSGKSPVSGFDHSSSKDVEVHQIPLRESSIDIPSSCEHSVVDGEVHMGADIPSGHHDPSGQGRGGQTGQLLSESPGQTPPHLSEGPHSQTGPSRYGVPKITQQPLIFDEATSHIVQPIPDGPARPHSQGRFDNSGPGRFDDPAGPHGPSRFKEHPQGSKRFEAPQASGRFDDHHMHKGPERFNIANQYEGQSVMTGSQRFESKGRFDPSHLQQGAGRFDVLGGQAPGRFDDSVVHDDPQMQPSRFVGPRGFDNPNMQGPGRYDVRFNNPQVQQGPHRYDVPQSHQGRMRFEEQINQPGAVRFEHSQGQLGSVRYDQQQQAMARFECPPGQQAPPPRFCPQNLNNHLRPHCPSMFAPQGPNPLSNPGQQSNFNMHNHRLAEATFGAPQSFQEQQNLSQGHNFNVQPTVGTPGFSSSFVRAPSSFYNPNAPGVSVGNMNTSVPGGNMQQPMNMISGLVKPQMSAPYAPGQPYVPLPQNPVPFVQTASQLPPPERQFGQVDVNALFAKLIDTGIIKSIPPDSAATESSSSSQSQPLVEEEDEEEQQDDDQNVPDLTTFALEDMKQRYDSVITKLYTGIQCYSCGMRFTASQTDVYADHLDWHYRQNRLEKDISKKVTHRRWYYSLTDWIEFEEIADLEERAKSQFFEKVNEEVVQKTQEAAKEKEFQSVKAAPDVVHESCEICQEQFEMYWEEEEEEWHLKNAIRVDEKTYHPSCYEDYKNTSSFVDCTPSPNKALLENPLNVFIKEEKEPSSCPSIKQEAETQSSCAQVNVKEEAEVKLEGESQDSAIIF